MSFRFNRLRWNTFLATCLMMFGALGANAATVGGRVTGGTAATNDNGIFQLIAPPTVVGNNNFDSPNLYAFDELQNVLLSSSLDVNISPLGSSTIAANTIVSSHYVFFDPGPGQTISGTVTFDSDILGISTSTSTLIASDFLSAPGVSYLSPSLRGLESGDTVSFLDARTIEVNFFASSPGDYIRVLTVGTTVVPVPSAAWIGLSLLVGLGATQMIRRRRLAI